MSDGSASRRETLAPLGLFLISAAILLLEVGQVRVFSFMLWHHVTYLVVTVTLLGFAAGGAWLAVARPADPLARAGRCAAWFGILTVVAFAVLARHAIRALPEAGSRWPALEATFSYLYLVVPYFFGGAAVAAALDGAGRVVSRRYAWNLAGSGGGALVALALLPIVGGPGVVLLAAALGLAGAVCLTVAGRADGRRGAPVLALVCAVAAFALLPFRERLFPFRVAAGKALDREVYIEHNPVLASVWDPICRVDVVGREESDPYLRLYQDGDAPTWIPSGDPARIDLAQSLPISHHALAYLARSGPEKNALVIGVGGGQDLATALVMGVENVLGAEINRSTDALMRGRFAAFCGDLYGNPRVRVETIDGRSVVARSSERFDVIQITGADTYAALSTGANLTAESYLYTQDAIHDYVDHLTDDGILAVLRWRFFPPRETLRLVGMMTREMRERGVADPTAHVAVVNVSAQGDVFGSGDRTAWYAVSLLKKSPFRPDEIALLERFCRDHPRKGVYSIALCPGRPGEREFTEYAAAVAAGPAAERAFEDAYPFAIDTVTDDRPFFFQFYRGRDVLADAAGSESGEFFLSVIGGGPAGLQVLWFSLAGAVLLLVVLVFLPLAFFRRGGLRIEGAPRLVLFFAAVGLAYLGIEIATIQRLTLFLGSPLTGLAAGFFGFLIFSGIGASVSGRVAVGRERRALGVMALLATVGALVHAALLPALFKATQHFGSGARILIAIAAIAPLAFAMGFPFPLGLRIVRARAAQLLPWAFGVNGAASVIASVLAILAAMDEGFSKVVIAAALLYALAAIALPKSKQAEGI